MIRTLLAALAPGLLAASLAAPAQDTFRAPRVAAPVLATLPAPPAKQAGVDAAGRLRVGEVRALPKAAAIAAWTPVAGGYVARLRAVSAGGEGLRVQLALGTMPGAMEVRVQGAGARVESMALDPLRGPHAWTPWTPGESQLIEIFSPVAPSPGAVAIAALLHFTDSPLAKAAATCTLSTACGSGDAALDAQIAERKRSLARIQFVSDGGAFLCSATLIDTPRRPAAYVVTANHCIEDADTAASVTAFWFYESSTCTSGVPSPAAVQTAGGMQLVFADFNVDASLLLMNAPPPAGARYAPLDAARMAGGEAVVSLSHPAGDTSRWALGTLAQEARDAERPYDMYVVNFHRGIIEAGSSGSGLFTARNGRLELRGVLSQGALELSCGHPDLFALYGRLDVLHAHVAQFIGAAAVATDDAPNRVADAHTAVSSTALDARAQPLTLARRLDYAGDVDVFRFTLARAAWVSAFTGGSLDTVSALLDADGRALEANDDAERGRTNTGITRRLEPGTYFVSVAHWIPAITGAYEVTLRADRVDTNYTALWWDPAESGWGLNVNHQGDILFATLFTYDRDGAPMWLVMSEGRRRADGSYSGTLYRTTGPAFDAAPWSAIAFRAVGTMRLAFDGADAGILEYSYDGVAVTKVVTRQLFRQPPECTWSAFDRSWETNYQDLWWNPAESGWGVNVTHQEDVVFATVFTYDADGRGLWLVMPEGRRTGPASFAGTLYSTRGPAFDAFPWTPIDSRAVGTLSLAFADGNRGTLAYSVDGAAVTKSIQRQVFSAPKTRCVS